MSGDNKPNHGGIPSVQLEQSSASRSTDTLWKPGGYPWVKAKLKRRVLMIACPGTVCDWDVAWVSSEKQSSQG